MTLFTRSNDLTVEKITNGFIITLCGRDKDGDYKTEKLFMISLEDITKTIDSYFNLKED